MLRRLLALTVSTIVPVSLATPAEAAASTAPNIIYILSDDLGYGDLGSYGQRTIRTPNLDRMAAEGARFTQHYAAPVCAPPRYTLFTGERSGTGLVRGLSPHVDLPSGHPSVAGMLRSAGYRTAMIGKWGLGDPGTSGVPRLQGFHHFYGYLTHVEAHDYFPSYLWRRENSWSTEKKIALPSGTYAGDEFTKDAKAFITRNADLKFFLALSYTNPHAAVDGKLVPSTSPYTNEAWPSEEKQKAAAITRLDAYVGGIIAHLKALGIDNNTIVMFSSDNGPHMAGGVDPSFFKSRGGLRGEKRSMYEGGLRVPFLARWPGRVPAGRVVPEYYANWDFMKTAAELAGITAPSSADGKSMAPALTSTPPSRRPDLYFEYHRSGVRRMAFIEGDWKLIRIGTGGTPQLYNLRTDLNESNNVASSNPSVVSSMLSKMASRREPHPMWP